MQFSALALYNWVREEVGTPLTEDSGSFNAIAADVTSAYGFPLEKDWAYDLANWDKPTPTIVKSNASAHRLGLSFLCPNLATVRASIQQGKPVSVGFECFDSLSSEEAAETGLVKFTPDERVVGGHAVLIVGYDDAEGVFYFLNSWGKNWGFKLPEHGTHGFGKLPYEYLKTGYASETVTGRTLVR